jgi:hypothetical protein
METKGLLPCSQELPCFSDKIGMSELKAEAKPVRDSVSIL